jgi:DMSO/TMAO reductase YedYZ heme-binding membrane subunit
MVKSLGDRWRYIHLLGVPALILGVVHTVLVGSHYLGATEWTIANKVLSGCVIAVTVAVLVTRLPWLWSLPFLKPFYTPPIRTKE